jgi:hypothetical protein
MKYNEVIAGFDSLTAAEKVRFLSDARMMIANDNASIRVGAKVQFKSKGGFIAGTFVRLKRKNAEVISKYDRYGMKSQFGTVRWSVPLAALIPLTPEKAKFFEFP